MKNIQFHSIQMIFILTACSFCQLDSLAWKSSYIGLSSYFTLPIDDSDNIAVGPQLISGGIHYKPYGSRLTVSLEVGGNIYATYFSRNPLIINFKETRPQIKKSNPAAGPGPGKKERIFVVNIYS
ncbi:MAG: hypothetical protein JW863_02310 [Chitinispirillaceae bacterium]|nr:hypothetical protein [Chitinispirillaceae bacterium]